MAYSGWEIDEGDRERMLALFTPGYPDVIAHHVTLVRGFKKGEEVTPDPADIRIVGYAKRDGVETLVVEVNGTINRPDGGIFHITWSIDREAGKKPFHSNELLAEHGFERIVEVLPIKTTPKVFY